MKQATMPNRKDHLQVLKLLRKYKKKGITMMDYLFSCQKTRLTNRISELKEMGYDITSTREDSYARYHIHE